MVYRIITFVLLAFAQPAYAEEVYQWTDVQGRQHYSDKKQRDATPYKLAKSFSYHKVRKVYDGDTLLLSDGRKIRLLGINTPEVEHSDKAAQAGGDAARKWLTQQLLKKRVRLEFDQEKRDKYKRHLAHIFTEQELHINRELVRLGYASINIFPPNLNYIAELLAAEQEAEVSQLGIWKYPEYQAKLTAELDKHNKRGWQRIEGTVLSVKNTRKSSYLKLNDNFSVRIKKKHLQYFDKPESLIGKNIELRGWVNKYKKGFSMLVKHPSAIKILD